MLLGICMLFRLVHPLKRCSPAFLMPVGRWRVASEVQSWKTLLPMLVSPLGSVTSFRLLHPAKVFVGSVVMLGGSVIFSSDLQFRNMADDMRVTDRGRSTSVRLAQFSKRLACSSVIFLGRTMPFRLEHPAKASEPIFETDFGMVMAVMAEQSWKALDAMAST